MTMQIPKVAEQGMLWVARTLSPLVLGIPLVVISLIIVLQGTG
jgi:hypothetical protein